MTADSTHSEGPHSYLRITCCIIIVIIIISFCFLIVMTIVYLQISLFQVNRQEGGSLETVKFLHVTSDVLLYSCTFVFNHTCCSFCLLSMEHIHLDSLLEFVFSNTSLHRLSNYLAYTTSYCVH